MGSPSEVAGLMERRVRPPDQPPGALTTEAAAALRTVATTDGERLLLGYYPHFTTNPFQALLYRAARAHGLAPVGVRSLDRIPELTGLQRAGIPTILHLHWLHLVLRGATSRAEAERLAGAFLRLLDDHLRAGGRLVWTVHNILPHEARFEDLEAHLSGEVAARCDVIHVLAAGTADYVRPHFVLPADRILHVPHMSYLGAYEDHVSRLDARHELGLLPDEFVFSVVGAIRPYKGLGTLLDAWQSLEPGLPRRLVIAGATTDEPGIAELIERAALDPSVIIDARKIPAGEIQVFLKAADAAVLPYLRSLNSGALSLAITFGLPVIVPEGGGLAEVIDERFARTVPPGEMAALAVALRDAPSWAGAEARAAALARARELAPEVVGERFATALRERIEGPPATSV
jgi:beta-1,4-mannosyltransferase